MAVDSKIGTDEKQAENTQALVGAVCSKVDIDISWRASSSNQKLICGQADPDFMKKNR